MSVQNSNVSEITTSNVAGQEMANEVQKQAEQLLELPKNYAETLDMATKQKIQSMVQGIDVTNRDFVNNYGAEQQTSLGKFADTMLTGRGSKELGETGELLNEAMRQISNYDATLEKKGIFSIFSNPAKKAQQIRDNYRPVNEKIEKIVQQLVVKKQDVSRVYDDFESLFVANKETYQYLTTIIYAGEIALEKAKSKMKQMQQDARIDPQEIRDFSDNINRFSKRIYDLKVTRTIAVSLAPQIRSIQNSAQDVEDTIQKTINTSIPMWKTQMAIALGIKTVQGALDITNQVTEVNNRMLLAISEAGKNLAVESAKANQRGVVDIETIRQLNQNIVQALTESTRITIEGIEKRKQDEKELKELETSLATAIRNIK